MNISQAAAIMGSAGGMAGTGAAKARKSKLCSKAQAIGQASMRCSDTEKVYIRCNRSDPSGCWIWMCAKTEKGYGQVCIRGKMWKAHRFSWHAHKGPIPDGMCVLHKCDNPPCVNPDHLFLGTNMDNQADCNAKGRRARGNAQPGSKFTPEIVRRIRTEATMPGFNQSATARKLGTSQRAIAKIVHRESWTHI